MSSIRYALTGDFWKIDVGNRLSPGWGLYYIGGLLLLLCPNKYG